MDLLHILIDEDFITYDGTPVATLYPSNSIPGHKNATIPDIFPSIPVWGGASYDINITERLYFFFLTDILT